MTEEVYKINGTEFCPTESRWLPRDPVGVQGDGRVLYPATRTFEIKWGFTEYSEWADAQQVYEAIEASGTAVVQIPAFPSAFSQDYGFSEYSGVLIAEPVIDAFFEGFPSSMVLVITNIVVK